MVRRIPPRPHCTQPVDGQLAATSFSLQPKKGEAGSSFSCFPPTTPLALLKLLRPPHDPVEWLVVWVTADEARRCGLGVVSVPTPEDPGHCEVRPSESTTKKSWTLLAKMTAGRVFNYEAAVPMKETKDLPRWLESGAGSQSE